MSKGEKNMHWKRK